MASINLGRVLGYSAYEIAVQNGYSGTEVEWLASLQGADGEDGTNGTDGVSPVASVERNLADTGAVITITDATGTTTATVYDGETPSLTGYATETYVDNAVGAIDVPTATSDLTNDSGFITSSDLSGYATTSALTNGLATKQDTLTAGDNITISNNVISATGGSSVSIAGGNYINVSSVDNDYVIDAIVYPSSSTELVTDTTIITINATPKYADDVTEWEVTNVDFSDPQWTNWLGESNRYMQLMDDNSSVFYSFYLDDESTSSPYAGTDGEVVTVDSYLTIAVPGDYSNRTLDAVQLDHDEEVEYGLVDYDTLQTAIGSVGGLPPISQGDSGKVLTVNRNEDGAEWVSPEAELPTIGASDEGKVLTVGVSGVEWDTPSTPSIATAQTAGLVKPDGSTITVDANGTISSASSGGLSPDSRNNVLLPATTGSENTVASGVGIYSNVLFGQKNTIIGSGYSSGNVIGGYNNSIYAGTANSNISGSGHSITLNVGTQQAPQSVIVGGNSNVLKGNRYGIVVGTGLTATGWNQAIFGNYNSDTTAKLVVGIGEDSNNKADGFKVTSAGAGVFASTVQATDFLDSNGNSIVGDSFPTINSGDAGKALVVNSGETGVEWATVGGGSAPVDPAHSSKNVYTGAGTFASAWATVMGSDRMDYRDYNFEENPIEVVDDVYEFTANLNIYDEVIAFDLIGNKDGAEGGYSGMLYKTGNNAWITGDGCFTLTTAISNNVVTYTITRYPEYIEAAFFMQLDEITHVIFNIDKLRRLMVGAEFAGDFPLPIGQTRWKDNGETERTLSIGLDEITLTDNHCMESPYNVERVEETNSISISAAEGVTYAWENHNDGSSASVGLIESGLVFNTSDGMGTDETFIWEVNGIQLKDQTTGDIYHLSIDNGQIVLTNNSQ